MLAKGYRASTFRRCAWSDYRPLTSTLVWILTRSIDLVAA
jgi:hypothetical protein